MNFMSSSPKGAALQENTGPRGVVELYTSKCEGSVLATVNSTVVSRKFYKERTSKSVDCGEHVANWTWQEVDESKTQLNWTGNLY